MTDCLDAALLYAKRGWKVFPLDGKRPYAGTNGFTDATTNRKQIRSWWRQWPEANVGIACSSRHGPIVLDLDAPNAKELPANDFLRELGLPETREAVSRKGRLHLYFNPLTDGSLVKRLIRPFRENGKKIALDILGDGGYVVAPPSIHPETGKRYRWTSRIHLAPFPSDVLGLIGDVIDLGKKSNAPPMPDIIGEGERDNVLTSLAGTMRRRGASEQAILAALREENATRVVPPLPDKDLRRIAKSIASKPPAGNGENLTDLGNARRFIAQHAESVRNVATQRRSWLIWDGTRFANDETGEVERMAKNTVRSLYIEASHLAEEDARDRLLKHASKSEQASRIHGLIDLAATEPEISITADALDRNFWQFNVENGTIDLKTGKLQKHRREDLITKIAPVEYDPKAQCPNWEKFLARIMHDDPELVTYLQRAAGYSITGDTSEECLFFCFGAGMNGKSALLETLRDLFGDYAQQSDFNSFLSSNGDGPRNDLARMRGKRFVTASEARGEKAFDGQVIKMLTGNDTIVARRLYEEHFEFRPQHKLWLAANHKPIVKEATTGFWRRMRLIPFTVNFENAKDRVDKEELLASFRAEARGILAWTVRGCLDWQRHGLGEPRAIQRATGDYKDENDLIGEFISQKCVLEKGSWISSTELYRVFSEWWSDTRGPRAAPISMGWFTRLLGEKTEVLPKKFQQVRGWKGIAVSQEVQ